MNYIRILSMPNPTGKVATIIIGEAQGLRERQSHEHIHCREDDSHPICVMCGQQALVWLDNADRWERNPNNCRS